MPTSPEWIAIYIGIAGLCAPIGFLAFKAAVLNVVNSKYASKEVVEATIKPLRDDLQYIRERVDELTERL